MRQKAEKMSKWKENMLFNYGKKLTVRAVYQNKKHVIPHPK